jgi:hypothetical protein
VPKDRDDVRRSNLGAERPERAKGVEQPRNRWHKTAPKVTPTAREASAGAGSAPTAAPAPAPAASVQAASQEAQTAAHEAARGSQTAVHEATPASTQAPPSRPDSARPDSPNPARRPAASLARIHPRRELWRRRFQWAALGVLALLIVGLAVGHALSGRSPTKNHTTTNGTSQVTVGTSQVTGGTVTSSATTTGSALRAHTLLRIPAASALAQADGSSFVTDDQRDVLVRFDPTTAKVQGTVHLAGRPDAMVLAGNELWVAEMVTNVVVEVDPRTLDVVQSLTVPAAPSGLAVLGADVWVTSLSANEVTPINLQTGVVGTPIQVLGGAVRVASGFGALWVTGTDDLLTRIIPAAAGSGPPAQRTVTVGRGPIGVVTGIGFVWVANAEDGTVSQVNPLTMQVAATLIAGDDPIAIAITSDNRVFVGFSTPQTVRVVSPPPESRAVPLAGAPRALLSVGNSVWVATSNPGRVLSVGS